MVKKLLVFSITVMLLGLLSMSCSDDETNNNNNNNNGTGPPNTGSIVINVSGGTNPTYSWSGGNVFSLTITRTSAPTVIVWGVTVPGTGDNITSPVTHGTVPTGAIQTSVANTETTLTAGVEYQVSVVRNNEEFGFKNFTP